jgi:hypothetical protein
MALMRSFRFQLKKDRRLTQPAVQESAVNDEPRYLSSVRSFVANPYLPTAGSDVSFHLSEACCHLGKHAIRKSGWCSRFPSSVCSVSAASKRIMIRKCILATALLLLATVQTLAANCDLRCSLMPDSSESHQCGHNLQTAPGNDRAMHCHGLSMDTSNTCSSVLSGSGCGITICQTHLDAIDKNFSPNESASRLISVTIPSLLNHSVSDSTLITSSICRPSSRRDTSAPLELRPGSSLRI